MLAIIEIKKQWMASPHSIFVCWSPNALQDNAGQTLWPILVFDFIMFPFRPGRWFQVGPACLCC